MNRKLRLRTTLVVPFVLQILTAVGLVWFITYRGGQEAVNEAATQLRSELTSRITEKLDSYTNIPQPINSLNASAFIQGDINVSNPQGHYRFWQQMQIYPAISYIYCGDEQGGFLGVGRLNDRDRSELSLLYSNVNTNFQRQDFAFDDLGNPTVKTGTIEQPFDPRLRPWYQAAKAAKAKVWSEIYPSFSTSHPTITASLPVYDRNNGYLMGVCATDFFLPAEVSNFLQELRIGKTGTAFIMERSGQLVATSSSASMVNGTGENTNRLLATKIDDLKIAATAEFLRDRYKNLNRIESVKKLNFKLDRERQYVQVAPFQDENLDWIVVIVIPEGDFMTKINDSRRNTFWFSVAALSIAIAIGIYTSGLITKPIKKVSNASNELAQGELERQVQSSPIVEVDTLANSFNSMAQQLKSSFDTLQESESRFRGLVDNIPGAIYRCQYDADWTMTYISDSIETICGYCASELIENQVRTYTSIIHREDRNLVEDTIQQAISQQKPYKVDYRLIHNDKSIHWVYERGQAIFDRQGNTLYLDGVIFDISDRKRAEEALRITEENYRSIFENALEGIFQSSPQGYYMSVNPALAKIYGYESPAEMIGSITDIGTQIYVDPQRRAEFRELLAKDGKVKNFEYRCYCKDKSIIWTQIDARVVRDNNGNVLYYEGIVQDITERKQREAELRKQLQELKIEIDQNKRAKDVETLTQSTFFQEVQEEVAEVDLDEFWS
ncbi:MAG: PAS domain S-box protein [Cyanobacteria bacterium P01_C01_bin.72]